MIVGVTVAVQVAVAVARSVAVAVGVAEALDVAVGVDEGVAVKVGDAVIVGDGAIVPAVRGGPFTTNRKISAVRNSTITIAGAISEGGLDSGMGLR